MVPKLETIGPCWRNCRKSSSQCYWLAEHLSLSYFQWSGCFFIFFTFQITVVWVFLPSFYDVSLYKKSWLVCSKVMEIDLFSCSFSLGGHLVLRSCDLQLPTHLTERGCKQPSDVCDSSDPCWRGWGWGFMGEPLWLYTTDEMEAF